MRLSAKQEILELIRGLYQAHEEVRNAVDGQRVLSAQTMLQECQEWAIHLGEIIEKMEGTECITITYLEKYCEAVYELHELLKEESDTMRIYDTLNRRLQVVEHSVEEDIRVRIEVAFFPYKAAMWDSLESIYLAAREASNCDPYVIPIPYYDKKSDKSLGMMHYEGNEFPEDIKITDWKSYNFEQRKPDVIFIHNAYDAWNRITCVHPEYFSSNLKKFTPNLVYVPYFVLDEIKPEDQKRVHEISHFCFLPGIINATKVIVQSDNMKKIYIREYLKAAKTYGFPADKKHLEEKILGIGSPKFDRMLRYQKEKHEIPPEWLEVIRKSDGDRKKVVLYNTGVVAFLQHKEEMIRKIKSVFHTFREKKDEIVLLWRPHPLLSVTIKSISAELWEQYTALEECYKSEGWGIYDDSADIERAIALSDAYYGDSSSVVQMFKKCGKPVMLQRVLIDNLVEGKSLIPTHFTIDKKTAWFTAAYVDGIFKTDLAEGKTYFEKNFPFPIKKATKDSWASIYKYGNKIVLTPYFQTNVIAIYDIEKEEFELLPIASGDVAEILGDLTVGYKNKLFVISSYSTWPMIIEVNLESNKIEKYCRINVEIPEGKEGRISGGEVIFVEGKIVIPIAVAPKVIIFDIESGQMEEFMIGCGMDGLSTICYDGDYFWISDRFGKIAKWRKGSGARIVYTETAIENELKETVKNIYGFAEEYMCFNHSACKDNYVVFFPGRAKKLLKINRDEGTAESLMDNVFVNGYTGYFLHNNFSIVTVLEEGIYAFSIKDNVLMKYNNKAECEDKNFLNVDKEYFNYVQESAKERGTEEVTENFFLPDRLIDFMDRIPKSFQENMGMIPKTVGQMIYDALCGRYV